MLLHHMLQAKSAMDVRVEYARIVQIPQNVTYLSIYLAMQNASF